MNDWPHYSEEDIAAVAAVLRSGRPNYWTGEQGRAFEREFAHYHGAAHAIAVANGSVALELALYALGIGPGDDVIVTPRSFVASVSSIVLRGARPVFADVDRDSQNITPETVESALTPATKAVLAVHLAGWPCDLDGLEALCRRRGLLLIEDCAQAHGATWRGCKVGGVGDAAAFSFCTDKIISTGGEGGMLLLKDEGAWRRAWSYKDHGKDWSAMQRREQGAAFRWVHQSFGTNWRLTEMQSAIGRVQLRKLDDWLRQRRHNAGVLREALEACPGLRVPQPPDHVGHAYYKFYCFVRPEVLKPGWDRDRILDAAHCSGVPCMTGSCPEIYREGAFVDAGLAPAQRLPAARELGETSLMLPVHPTLEEADLRRFAQALAQVVSEATA